MAKLCVKFVRHVSRPQYVILDESFINSGANAESPIKEFIATSLPWDPILTPTPLQYDVHVYDTPSEHHQQSLGAESNL